jgi:hypothetical protein
MFAATHPHDRDIAALTTSAFVRIVCGAMGARHASGESGCRMVAAGCRVATATSIAERGNA